MIRPEDIAGYSPELRELLEFSCIYLGAADGKFSSKEQEWIDRHFGEGEADRLMAHSMNADWSFTFDRIMRIVRHSLTESEKHLVAREARVWLKNFIASDGLEPEEQIRLDEFYQWLEKVGLPKLPKAKLGGAPVAPPTVIPADTKGYTPQQPDPKHDPPRKTSGKGIFRSRGKSNPTQQEDFDYEQKFFKARLSAKAARDRAAKFREKLLKKIPIIILIALIALVIALVAIYVHGILFGSYIPWDVKKKIIWPWQLFWGFSMCWTPVLVVIITRLLLGYQGPHGADMNLGLLIVMGIVIGFFILMFMENYIKTPDLKDMHKPTPKEFCYGGEWRRER